jgi:hypothetical protein
MSTFFFHSLFLFRVRRSRHNFFGGFCFRAGDSESYASVDINKPRWLNAFTREKERWTEPTKDLDNVAFATVRTEHICIEDDDAKIGVAILLFLAFSTTRTTREW